MSLVVDCEEVKLLVQIRMKILEMECDKERMCSIMFNIFYCFLCIANFS